MKNSIQTNFLEKYKPISKIGSGGFGKVYKAVNRKENKEYAI